MKPVIAQFLHHVFHDQERNRHAEGKPEDVDQGKELISPEIPEGNDQKVPEHALHWHRRCCGQVRWHCSGKGLQECDDVQNLLVGQINAEL